MSFFPRDLAAPAVSDGPIIEWEEPACLLCGSSHAAPLVEAPDSTAGGSGLWFAVVQCQECGLCFTSPRPSAETIGRFYPSEYGPHRTKLRRHGLRRVQREEPRKEYDEPAWHGQGRLLDFGCGGGGFLAQMQRRGWQVTGLDVSSAAVERVRTDLGLRALAGTLPHPELCPASFDVITMWHALEHVHNPMNVLREAHRLLVPGGKLIIAVPNIDSLPFRWFGSAWFGLDLPRHLTHFAPWTLHLMLERAGFHVGPVRMVRHSDWLRSCARLAARTGGGTFWHRWLRLRLACRVVTLYCWLTAQSDGIIVTAER